MVMAASRRFRDRAGNFLQFLCNKTVFISDLLPVNPRLFPFLLFMMKKFPAQNHFFRLKYQIRSATTSADTAATVM